MGSGCANTYRAAARVLARNGATSAVPVSHQWCGALQVHEGMMEVARTLARH